MKFSESQLYCYNRMNEVAPGDESFTAADLSTKERKVAGNTLASFIKPGYARRINEKSPYRYINLHKEYIEEETSFSESDGYTKHTKTNNQYFGEYMEKAVCSVINQEEIINDTGYPFTERDIILMNRQANDWVSIDFPYAYKAEYLGRKTATADCDIIINDTEHVELKYVSKGNGTYLNTSLYYFKQFGFNFHDYMENMGYIDLLIQLFGNQVKPKDNSPVNQTVSSNIRKQQADIYQNIILPADKKVRQIFVNDLINYFTQPEHYNDLQLFGHQMLTKETLTSQKRNPNFVSVYGYKDDVIRRIYPDQILQPNEPIIVTQEESLNRNKETIFSIKLNKIIRVQIGWQNGTGLNNPTIRVFIETE